MSLVFVVFGVITLLVVVYVVYQAVIWPLISPLRKIPGPPPTSFWTGHFDQIRYFTEKEGPFSAALQWAKEYGQKGLLYYKFHFLQDRVLLLSIDAIKHVATKTNCYYKPKFLRTVAQLNYLGEGLLFSEDILHDKQRRLIQPFFTHRHVSRSLPPHFIVY
jgi:cytochrome P450